MSWYVWNMVFQHDIPWKILPKSCWTTIFHQLIWPKSCKNYKYRILLSIVAGAKCVVHPRWLSASAVPLHQLQKQKYLQAFRIHKHVKFMALREIWKHHKDHEKSCLNHQSWNICTHQSTTFIETSSAPSYYVVIFIITGGTWSFLILNQPWLNNWGTRLTCTPHLYFQDLLRWCLKLEVGRFTC